MSWPRPLLAILVLSLGLLPQATQAHAPHVLRVGTWNGWAGQFKTIQEAVDAALT